MKGYDQRPNNPDNWLHNGAENDRVFVKVIHLPEGQSWIECTNEEKEEWEREHQPEPEQEGGEE